MINRSILQLIGNTPILELKRINPNSRVRIFAKLEFLNPSGSPKDRIAKVMIEGAEKRGRLKPGMTIVEATTGSTGISFSMVAAVKGYPMIVVMPEGMSNERKKMMKAYGAKIIFTTGAGIDAVLSVKKARQLCKKNRNFWFASQFNNPDNIKAHIQTGEEIWEQTGGKVDVFVAAYGTGGLLTGVAKVLKEKKPQVVVVAVEPEECALLLGKLPHPHRIEGIADGFLPKNLHRKYIDKVITVSDEEAIKTAQKLARLEGTFCGTSSGANVFVALKVAETVKKGIIVTVLPDRGERYFSTDLCP